MGHEQKRNPHEATPESDIYALGISWYEMLTYSIPTPEEFAARVIAPIKTNKDVSELIMQMTNFRPEERPSLEAIINVLEKIGTA